ncbi:MAG: penicillin-binding protein 1C [Methylovulum sp.]|nr:penicillin-binding protein 1C [Methylovulum sp.]
MTVNCKHAVRRASCWSKHLNALMAGKSHGKWAVVGKTRYRLGLISLLLVLAAVLCRNVPHPPLSGMFPSSTAVLAADGSLLRLTLAADEQYRLWLPLADLPPTLQAAVKLQEDQWFNWHPGLNPIALLRGAWETYTGGHRQGGSTLTMQLARLLYRLDTRQPLGKIRQIFIALWLELRYSKHDIFEAYLNLAPYGHNIQGVAAASLIYFGKTVGQLSLPEILTLAVIPQRPNAYHGRDEARARLFGKWRQSHAVSDIDQHLLTLPVPLRSLSQLPFAAPHLVTQILNQRRPTDNHQLQTTLKPDLQHLLARQIQYYIRQYQQQGLSNAAALLVDTRTMDVVALQGSADFHNAAILGQVNGVLAKRSPGSTLKPFVYGLALDQGLVHPLSVLKDAPTAFGAFQPENFDGRFVGPISVREALIRSRNIPALAVASQLKRPNFYDFLSSAGISKLKPPQHYGLSLVLGGGELTMAELTTLYAMLANQGVLKPLNYLQNLPTTTTTPNDLRLLSPEASYLVLDMLASNPRPDGMPTHGETAWKTGTSWGFRDAWSIGVTGPYVLAVWLGNFDGSANPALVGIKAAAPLFFRIADALQLARPSEFAIRRHPPATLKRLEVCSASGELPNIWCPKTEATWFIPGKSPIKISTLHQPVMVDNRTGLAVCPPYDTATSHQEIFEFWPSDMMQLFREAGIARRAAPQQPCQNPTALVDGEPPRISSPLTGGSYTLRLSRPDETIALQASSAGDANTLYWFANHEFLGTVAATQQNGLNWRPGHAGTYTLSVVDDHNRNNSRQLMVGIIP